MEKLNITWIALLNPSPGVGKYETCTIDYVLNCAYCFNLITTFQNTGIMKLGIYTRQDDWFRIFRNKDGSPYFKNLPLANLDLDGDSTFSDFTSYGGWAEPN